MTFATQLASAFTPIGGVYDGASITQALSWAQTFVEEYCNRGENGFDLVTGDIVLLDPKRNPLRGGLPHRSALLPQIPVANISLVEAWLQSSTGAMAWTTITNYGFTSDTGLIYDTTGEPGITASTFGPTWPWLPQSLRVTYDHGYSTVPSALINAACRFAQQYLENPALMLQRGVGQLNDRFAGNTGGVGIVINVFDERIMDRYTLVSVA